MDALKGLIFYFCCVAVFFLSIFFLNAKNFKEYNQEKFQKIIERNNITDNIVINELKQASTKASYVDWTKYEYEKKHD